MRQLILPHQTHIGFKYEKLTKNVLWETDNLASTKKGFRLNKLRVVSSCWYVAICNGYRSAIFPSFFFWKKMESSPKNVIFSLCVPHLVYLAVNGSGNTSHPTTWYIFTTRHVTSENNSIPCQFHKLVSVDFSCFALCNVKVKKNKTSFGRRALNFFKIPENFYRPLKPSCEVDYQQLLNMFVTSFCKSCLTNSKAIASKQISVCCLVPNFVMKDRNKDFTYWAQIAFLAWLHIHQTWVSFRRNFNMCLFESLCRPWRQNHYDDELATNQYELGDKTIMTTNGCGWLAL